MNKYKESLYIYSRLESETTVDEYTPLEYKKARKKLEELVERATPKKPNERYYENYYCPKCHKQVFMSWKKCKYCGQAIDWSEEE